MRRALDNVPVQGLDPKKGPGGILDLDFLAQFFALRLGWRMASTRAILERLRDEGLVDRATAQGLLSAWHRLRHVERRLRLTYGRAEVYVPRQGRGLEVLARQLGGAGAHAGEQLVRELVRSMTQVRETFDTLLTAGA
jgi:glutamine synthetase adenylyltransferase